ncbi:SANT/Myb_domain [Hexamita inflata]|uniref:SANT/Myb_domain n=1 Tax=Hexamita inflata TaxID=28002 RepID=A0ABP1GW75_9EUKA
MQKKYISWTEQEKEYIVQEAKKYRNTKINWMTIQRQLPHRTVQQCKSFYNNQLKHYELDFLLTKKSLATIAKMALLHLMTCRLQDVRVKEKRAYIQAVTEEVLTNVFQVLGGNRDFEYDTKLLALVREMILVFNQSKTKLVEDIYLNDTATLLKKQIDHDMLVSLIQLAKTFDSNFLLEKINVVLVEYNFRNVMNE